MIHIRPWPYFAALALTLMFYANNVAAQHKPDTAFHSDDPVAVRAALTGKPEDAGKRSIAARLHDLVAALPHRASHREAASSVDPEERSFVFVVNAPLGILYESRTHLLKVDVPLADDERPGYIVLKKTVTGSSGRRLVIAPDAKAKGYVQTIDRIELETAGKRATAHGRLRLSQSAFAAANGDFAIALVCHLVPPYLTDRHDHQDPTDDEPTDITTRTSTLYANVDEVWLIDVGDGSVLSTSLRLTK
ncbi:hypothetical protein [Paraburkholderia humisilvae]|uniref:hypothetical protein n=1 Tax=Paraburkholderia humisilvae TaxID=627669 RepID=UPI001FEAD800|nr:hypothetical protein [Paraburkholderia humisilvae]